MSSCRVCNFPPKKSSTLDPPLQGDGVRRERGAVGDDGQRPHAGVAAARRAFPRPRHLPRHTARPQGHGGGLAHPAGQRLRAGGAARTVGPPVALSLRYGGYGSPLILCLEEGGVVTDCSLRTQEPEDPLDFEFGGSDADEDRQTPNKVILKAEGLKEAFADLELSSSGAEVSVHITMSPARPHFRLSTFGPLGSTHCDFPRDSDMVESFHCTKAQTNQYKASFLKPSAKALSQASKVSVRMDWRGLLSLQFMIPNDGEVSFVEYYCCPDDVQEEEDDDDEVNSDDS
uniref:Cell cycle checkpoint protein RAD1 isoform X3 n=1 Tax=Petromyzon marinus TaxID=7757 RepID=A0AAJ7U7U0_PETMA|nr:cell cycle checkpoint protein RAD1 isoform X3 [Petromyzon marinus]